MQMLSIIFGFFVPILIILVLLLVLILGYMPIQVPESHVAIVERFGRFRRILPPGLQFYSLIFGESIKRVMIRSTQQVREDDKIKVVYRTISSRFLDLREQIIDFPQQEVITKENVTIIIDALLFYRIVSPYNAVYNVANLPDSIEQIAKVALRDAIGSLTLDEAIQNVDKIKQIVSERVRKVEQEWGIKLVRVEIQKIEPPKRLLEAMELQMKAEREKRAKLIEAEAYRRAEIEKAEGDREAAIRRAEGEMVAKILEAEGQAQALQRLADAEAITVDAIMNKIGIIDAQSAMKYIVALRYVEALKKMADGQATKIYFPIDILSSLDAFTEALLKKFGKK